MARIEDSLTRKISSSVNACENRIVKFYTDQGKNCSMRAKQVSSALQKKLDKISTKADSALKSSHSNCTSDTNTTVLDSKINNMQLELEKIEHEIGCMGEHLNDVINCRTMPLATNESIPNTAHPAPNFDLRAEDKFHQNKNPARSKSTETHKNTIMFCDSNKKFLDAHRLWRGIKIIPCGSLIELSPLIHSNTDIKSAGMVIIHVGVNDTDKKNGQEVFSNLQHVIKDVEEVAPNAKIILSEITPRKDGRDSEVRNCNDLINTMYNNNEHPNLLVSA